MDDGAFSNYYISTGTPAERLGSRGYRGWTMEHKQTGWLIIMIFAVLGILGSLASIAIPHTTQMAYASKAEDRTLEFFTIQAAVAGMLSQSPAHQIQSIGPTTNMNLVRTTDAKPLVLADFLPDVKDGRLTSGYTYSFTADGLVLQYGEWHEPPLTQQEPTTSY
jgi:hypothetical protein